MTETPWAYLKVRQTEYEKVQPTLSADLFNGVPPENGRAVEDVVRFELRQGDIPQLRVSSDSVVEHFEILEQLALDRRVVLVVDHLKSSFSI